MRHARMLVFGAAVTLGVATGIGACGSEGTGPASGVEVVLALQNLRALDPETEGTYHAWAVRADWRAVSAGRFVLPAEGRLTVESPIDDLASLMITVEPPGDDDDRPSDQWLLGGMFEGDTAALSIEGYVTPGVPLEREIGGHVLFTPSDNLWAGYPSNEDAGIWVFNIEGPGMPTEFYLHDPSSPFFLKMAPLREGWVYEGWVVRDYGTPAACWISYGKWVPGEFDRLNTMDNTGLGPFSGWLDYVGNPMGIQHNFPGDDWVENPHDFPVPCGLSLPFDMNGNAAEGVVSPWTHVMTVEPAFDVTPESPNTDLAAPLGAKPFLIQPYRNPFGEGAIDSPRVIEYRPEYVPSGTAIIIR